MKTIFILCALAFAVLSMIAAGVALYYLSKRK